MKSSVLIATVFPMLVHVASAEIIRGINLDFVTIGNPGNFGDTRAEANPHGGGAVPYVYQIGKYEVTNAQWNAFVSAVAAPIGNPSDAYDTIAYWTGEDVPTTKVSWYEAAQFCNFLTSGDKSRGAYLFNGTNTNPGDFLGIDRNSAISNYGIAYVIPTEDEWYKAAYYKPDGSGYATYANGQDSIPSPDNGWNYSGGPYSSPWNVGAGTMEQNGTFDMMGNVWELTETPLIGATRVRGGSYLSFDTDSGFDLKSSWRGGTDPDSESINGGFRVASIPEPATALLFALGALLIRKRFRN